MAITFTTTIMKDNEKNATGIPVPAEVITQLGAGKKPKVVVTVNGFSYRSTVAAYGDVFLIPLSQERRAEAGVEGGEQVEITLELDTEPRMVEVPDDLRAALEKAGMMATFEGLAYSKRKEFARQVNDAKTQETRERRIGVVVTKVGEG